MLWYTVHSVVYTCDLILTRIWLLGLCPFINRVLHCRVLMMSYREGWVNHMPLMQSKYRSLNFSFFTNVQNSELVLAFCFLAHKSLFLLEMKSMKKVWPKKFSTVMEKIAIVDHACADVCGPFRPCCRRADDDPCRRWYISRHIKDAPCITSLIFIRGHVTA